MYSHKLKRNELFRHFLFWFSITIFVVIVDPPEKWYDIKELIGTFLIMFSYVFVYYTEYLWILPGFYHKKKGGFILLTTLTLLIYLSIRYSYIKLINPEGYLHSIQLNIFLNIFFLFFIVLMVAFGSYKNKLSILRIKKQAELEASKIEYELSLFKSQFRSDVVFPLLNNFFKQAVLENNGAANAIQIYSSMLQYTLNNKPDEKVSLNDEINYINKFIVLKKILSKNVYVDFIVEGDASQYQILPRLLITYVENAFKHGVSHLPDCPIRIKLNCGSAGIIFEVSNKKNNSKYKISTGIGQKNASGQLELFYENKHELKIMEDEEHYTSRLLLS